jgi:hypothetical protein
MEVYNWDSITAEHERVYQAALARGREQPKETTA